MKPVCAASTDESFAKRLAGYKQSVDEAVSTYSMQARTQTLRQYGAYPSVVHDVFLDLLSQGGKRLRGTLVCTGYALCGGKDMPVALQAAVAIELLHAYILIVDDIQDRSDIRRNRPTAHRALAQYHKEHALHGDADHAGMALALDAALAGAHAAQALLADLAVTPELRLNVIAIVNQAMITTAHGQTLDIMNELVAEIESVNLEHVLEWKTATYTILNPLQVGMALAGASNDELAAIVPYANHAGKAFQIADDLLGVFGDEKQSGKSNLDDIREGKRTVLTVYALTHAAPADRDFLQKSLGNKALTRQQFVQCQEILERCGARAYAQTQAKQQVAQALQALSNLADCWNPEQLAFLRGLTNALANRNK